MNKVSIEKAAQQFAGDGNLIIHNLGNGLIHQTFQVTNADTQKKIVLQAINKNVFKNPGDILFNYELVYNFLVERGSEITIPAPAHSKSNQLLWIDEDDNYWRATAFVANSFSPDIASDEEAAYTVAKSFANFTRSLSGLNANKLKSIIPGFHNLSFRYNQFEDAIATAPLDRLLKATHVIAELRQRKHFVGWYEMISASPDYPDRVMHHDCKISNILFDSDSGKVICPVDLDTLMPGKFFSDLGDMIRSMACTVDENSNKWEEIDIRPAFYKNIVKGYLEGIGDIFSKQEKNDINYAGLIMIYMQSLRFVSDFLNNDIYYKISYPEQNLNRTLNQLILLEKLEAFLNT
ncbi:MAG: phosphotransferase [Bacteroidetes bacterium]|nr:phosphotransferase [Bacteroidota bacterium]